MRAVRTSLLGVAVACLLGTSSAAWACDVYGSVVCSSDQTIGVAGVGVTLTPVGLTEPVYSGTSGADGTFQIHVGLADTYYDVNLLEANAYCDPSGSPITLDPILVDDAEQCGTPPPPPVCEVEPPNVTFPYCPARPIGNPRAECALFGLDVLDKDDELNGQTWTVTQTAAVAIVKAAGCYDVFYNVVAGVTVVSAPYKNAISHVTYCACPEP